MTKTQIQLPDNLYENVKKLAKAKEISFAEICRRGLEYMLTVYPLDLNRNDDWELPEPKHLGKPKVHYSEWRSLAHDQIDLKNE